jgi:hypothetical protein
MSIRLLNQRCKCGSPLAHIEVCFRKGTHGDDHAEDYATARLIAAAPELLQALRHVLPHVGVGYSGAQRHEIVEVARAAIAKATGKIEE